MNSETFGVIAHVAFHQIVVRDCIKRRWHRNTVLVSLCATSAVCSFLNLRSNPSRLCCTVEYGSVSLTIFSLDNLANASDFLVSRAFIGTFNFSVSPLQSTTRLDNSSLRDAMSVLTAACVASQKSTRTHQDLVAIKHGPRDLHFLQESGPRKGVLRRTTGVLPQAPC